MKRQKGDDDPGKTKRQKKDAARLVNVKRFAEFAGAADVSTRSRTVIRGFQKVVQSPHAEEFNAMVTSTCDVFGTLRHLITIYLNTKAAADPSFPGLLDQNYIARLFKYFAGQPVAAESMPDDFLQAYIAAHPLPPTVQATVDAGYIAQPAQHLAREMLTAAEAHISTGFDARLEQYARIEVECLMWHARPSMSEKDFRKATETCARAIIKGACADDRATAGGALNAVIDDLGGDWDATQIILSDVSELLAPLRTPPPRGGRAIASPRKAFLYHLKAKRADVLRIMRTLQEEAGGYARRRGEIWVGINTDLPSLPGVVATHDQVWAVRHRLHPPPTWCRDSSEELSPEEKRDYATCKRLRADARTEAWRVRAEPGTLDPPKSFTLLPYSSLAPAFITLDGVTLSVMAERIRKRLQAESDARWQDRIDAGERLLKKDKPHVEKPWKSDRNDFLFWTGAFAFYPGQHPDPPRRPRPLVRAPTRRRLLKADRANDRGGLPMLAGQEWMLDPVQYAARVSAFDGTEPPPLFVNRIKSDGLQVHVTLVDRRGEESLPGVANLHEGGYVHVTETFDVTRHR